MPTLSVFRVVVISLVVTLSVSAQKNEYTLVALPQNLDLGQAAGGNGASAKDVWFDYDNAVLRQDHVLDLINSTSGRCPPLASAKPPADHTVNLQRCGTNDKSVFPGADDYIIFHVVNWDGSNNSLKVAKQNWYVYNTDGTWDATFFTGTRIFGKKSVYLYTIHLNRPAGVLYEEQYTIDETHKTPAFLTHLLAIGQLFGVQGGGGAEKPKPLLDMWYAFRLDVKYVPADIQITPVMVIQSSPQGGDNPPAKNADQAPKPDTPTSLGPPPVEVPANPSKQNRPSGVAPQAAPADPNNPPPAKPDAAGGGGAGQAAGATSPKSVTLDAKTFDNEAKYHIDFSVGVPITKITDLSYVQTSNSVTAANVDKQKIFALFDYYPVAVDIKNTILPKFPYLLTGVSLSSQPLKKALFGVGWGPIYANFYAALLLNTQSAPNTWSCGDKLPSSSAGMTLSNHSCPEFNFGLNVAVGAITDALKNKASSGTPANGGTAGKK